MKNIAAVVMAVLTFTLVQCKKDDTTSEPTDNFDRKALFDHLGNDIVLPDFLDFVNKTKELQNSAYTLHDSITEENLDSFQNQWEKAARSAKVIEEMKFGPLNDTKMYSLLDKWPIKVSFIEGFIAGNDPINASYIGTKGATSKGLAAIEYLAYDPENGNTVILDSLQSNPRRLQYLVALCENLYQEALQVASLWSPLGDNYVDEYGKNLQNGLNGSLSLTVNQMSSLIEFMVVTKLGKPLAKELNSSVDYTKLEAWRSGTSRDLLLENIKAFRTLFTGGEGKGFDDYLDYLQADKDGQKLSTAILNKTDTIISELQALPGLEEQLQTDPSDVDAIYQDLDQLLVLIKVDMASALSVTITFSDNDGD